MWNMWPAAGGSSDAAAAAHDIGIDDTDSLISMSLSMFEEDLFFGLDPLDNNLSSSMQKHFDFHADDDEEEDDDDEEMDKLLLHSQLAEELLFGDEDIDPVMQEVEAVIVANDLNSVIDQFEQTEKTITQFFHANNSSSSSSAGNKEGISSSSSGFSILKQRGGGNVSADCCENEDVVCLPAAAGATVRRKPVAPAATTTTTTMTAKSSGVSRSAAVTNWKLDYNSMLKKQKKKKKKNGRKNGGISLLAKPIISKTQG